MRKMPEEVIKYLESFEFYSFSLLDSSLIYWDASVEGDKKIHLMLVSGLVGSSSYHYSRNYPPYEIKTHFMGMDEFLTCLESDQTCRDHYLKSYVRVFKSGTNGVNKKTDFMLSLTKFTNPPALAWKTSECGTFETVIIHDGAKEVKVLIFVSFLEHSVVVVCDKKITTADISSHAEAFEKAEKVLAEKYPEGYLEAVVNRQCLH